MSKLEELILRAALALFERSAAELDGAGRPRLARLVRRHRRRIESREKKPAQLRSARSKSKGRVLVGRVVEEKPRGPT